jgi:hypothetical protein
MALDSRESRKAQNLNAHLDYVEHEKGKRKSKIKDK